MISRWIERAALLVLALVALAIGKHAYDKRVGELAVVQAKAAKFEQQRDSLRKVKLRADTVFRTDTIRLRVVRFSSDTVLQRITDTVVHVDTVRLLLAAERRACDDALSSCNIRVQALIAERDNLDSLNAALRKMSPSKGEKLLTNAKWLAVGAVACLLLCPE